MADSTTNLDQILSTQSAKEATANALLDAASPATDFGRHASACNLLTWGYYGGKVNVSGTVTNIANGTLSLTASSTCYIEIDSAGSVTFNTSAFTAGRTPLYQVVTGSSAVTSWIDKRLSAVGIVAGGAVGMANPMTTAGDLIDGGSSGTPQRLGIGTSGQILTVVSGAPAWAAAGTGFANPMTTAGDLIDGGTAGAAQRLGIGSAGQVLTVVSGAPAWAAAGAGGNAAPNVNAQTGTTYTLVIGDAPQASCYQGIVTMNNASANTLTIPANGSVAFPVGTIISVIQLGAGQTTIAITTDTLNNPSSVTARARYSTLVLQKVATTTWVLGGDMT